MVRLAGAGEGEGVTPQIRRIADTDSRYPAALLDLEGNRPRQLFAIGDLELLAAPQGGVVAIVGTREASPYGSRVAKAMGRAFAEAGAVVVSGMARGVDSAAHEGALEAGGATIAVLGTGPDVPYPAWNRSLHSKIASRGLVLSESVPGTKAFHGCFPRRNRIIAALSKATIVVEAGFKSGALNTASQALELGRIVGAVPGRVDDPMAMGSNHLMRDGGQVIASIPDALGLLGLTGSPNTKRPELGTLEAELWDALGLGEADANDLASRLQTSVRDLLTSVSKLELMGLVEARPTGLIARITLETLVK